MVNPSSKLTRMRLELEEYDFTIEYLKRKDSFVVDALSRRTISELKSFISKSLESHRKILRRKNWSTQALDASKLNVIAMMKYGK